MANQVTPVKTRTENCVDETILSTPLPEATSTVNKNLSPCFVAPKPIQTSGTTSRLTNTIKELESFSKALSNVGKIPTSRRSALADSETDRSFDSKASLGLLDIDKLLENETMDDSQDIMKTLYQIRNRRVDKSSKDLGKPVAIPERDLFQQSDQQNLSSKVYQNQTRNAEENTMASRENSCGVPSRFLASESYISEGPSIDSQSFTARNDLSISETSAEVAAITQKDSFASGRLTFEPSELSARSTSIGGSSEISSRNSDFSGVAGEGQIVVRPSWIGLEGYGDEPINISVGEYFRLKSNVLSDTIDVQKSGGERPNFGMEIRSPGKRGEIKALVSDSFEASLCAPEMTAGSKLNETQVLSTPSLSQQTNIADVSECTDENPSYISSAPCVIATPSINCINNILNEIDVNDSPDTMARKFLEYTITSKENKALYDKNVTVHTPSNECDNDQPWVKIPEEILLPVDEGKLSKKQSCVGIGSTFHVPITNVTSSWLKYEVTFVKSKSAGNVVVQKLPVPTLISPESCVEFEAIFAPMSTGSHSIVLEIKVSNFMVPGKSAQIYQCQLILKANIPKIMLMNENMKEIKAGAAIDFGLLPEHCTRNIQLLILNVGKSDIPIRVVIQEMPSNLHTFEISGATRSPSADLGKHYEGCPSAEGFALERKDLLTCDLLGSGPNSILAVSLAFSSPNINEIPQTFAHSMDTSKIIKLTTKLKVELDVPSSLSSDLTILKEFQLCGSVGETNLVIGVSSEPVTLYSEEMILPTAIHDHKIFKKVSEYIPICNSSGIPLQLNNVIHCVDGNNLLERDVMVVDPDNLTIQPGEKFDIKVTYHPNTKKVEECDRVLIIQVNPNGPSYKVQLRGVPFAVKGRHSMERKENRPKLQAAKASLPRTGMTDIIQASQTALVWGSVSVGSGGAERSIALKNTSDMVVRLTLTVNGTDDFKFLNHNSDCVGQASFDLLPKKAEKLKFFFWPKALGPINGKLSISICNMKCPERSFPNKMIILLGYGGHSEIEAVSLPKDLAGKLWLNLGLISPSLGANPSGARPSTPTLSSVKNRIQILNSGTLPSLVKITPLKLGVDSKLLSNLEDGREHHVTIKPDEFELAPSSCATVWITYVHGSFSTYTGSSRNQGSRSESLTKGSKRIQEEVAKLIVVSGDVPTSSRLHRICKIADDTSNIKSSDLFCDLNAVNLNFIEAATSHDEFQMEGNDEYCKENNILCDPVTKEALNSLVQNVSSFEVMLAIEKIENSDDDLRHSVGDLTLALESSSVEFHPLMDDGDTNHFQITVPHSGNSCVGRRKDGDFRENRIFGDPKGMKDFIHLENLTLVRTHGCRENVFADTSAIIFPLTKVGDKSSGKLTLRNISPEIYKVEFHLRPGPFIPPKKDIVIAGQKHVSFKVKFVPNSPGFYETTMIMKATSQTSTSENIIIVALKGRAD